MSLKPGDTIMLILQQLVDSTEGFIGHGIDGFVEWKHTGTKTSPLVGRAVLANPFAYKPLFFCVRRVELDDGLLRLLTACSNVGMEPPERFVWDVPSNAPIAFGVELDPASFRRNHAAPGRGRRMRDSSLAGVTQE
jgi:hypothetical protein